MGRLSAASIALVLAACGGAGPVRLRRLGRQPAARQDRRRDQPEPRLRSRTLVAEGDCVGAEDAVGEVAEEVEGLRGVDKKLKAALRQGTNRLDEVVVVCGERAEEEAAEERAGRRQKKRNKKNRSC